MAHYRKIVRDEQVRDAAFRLQIFQQVQDLRAYRKVERGDRFVQDQQFRIGGDRAGDADALPLPAGKLVRVAGYELWAQPDRLQQLSGASYPRLTVGDDAVCEQRFRHDIADHHARVECCEWVLKNDVHIAAQTTQCLSAQRHHIGSIETYFPGSRLNQTEYRASSSALTAATLADETERFALRDR